PAGATSNMKRKIPRDAADRIAVAGPERDVRNLVPFLRMEKCFFLTSPFIEHEAKNSEGRSRSYCSRWAGAGCQKFGSFPADGDVFFLDIPFYRTRGLYTKQMRSLCWTETPAMSRKVVETAPQWTNRSITRGISYEWQLSR